jgi:hypothetical protein
MKYWRYHSELTQDEMKDVFINEFEMHKLKLAAMQEILSNDDLVEQTKDMAEFLESHELIMIVHE